MRLQQMIRRRLVAVVLAAVAGSLSGQTCDNPTLLCGEQWDPLAISADTLETSIGCIDTPWLAVGTFTTNSITSVTGNVTLNVSGLNCSTGGVPSLVKAVVVYPNQQDFCDIASYVPVSDCIEMSSDFSLVTQDLAPNTRYLVLVGTSHDVTVGVCQMEVYIDGPAIGIDACCAANLVPGQSVTLTVEGGDPDLGYTWMPGTGLNTTSGPEVISTPEGTTTYAVDGFIGACAYSDDVTVTVGNPFEIPTGFTPNDDLINDLWLIPGLLAYERAEVMVYNRYGALVFRSIGYVTPWDGKNGTRPVPEGTYYYAIDLNDPNLALDPITGYVSIVR